MMHVALKKEEHSRTGIVLGNNEYLNAFTEADRGINLQSYNLLVP